MKLKMKKTQLKHLNNNKNTLAQDATPQVAGGFHGTANVCYASIHDKKQTCA
ncbi:hypothetical protein [Pseudoalteromonas rubra]|uniref:hypothetical protein n=1 Tax=Pseudoalteromonas rubra TaxID=43658 RepID=UPI0013DE44E8|nr:hypothetical protein [Pseudoalteromonas rubra]